jgi:hypothetical protein
MKKLLFMKSFMFACIAISLMSFATEWKLAKTKDKITVYTRAYSSKSSLKEFKAVTSLNATKDQVEALLLDVKNMTNWYDMISDVQVIKVLSGNSAIYRITFDFPMIVQDRYTTIKASLVRDANGNIIVNSAYEDIAHTPVKNAVLVKNLNSSWTIAGKDNELTVTHIGFMDPAGNVPDWLVNSSLVDGPIKTLSAMKKKLNK